MGRKKHAKKVAKRTFNPPLAGDPGPQRVRYEYPAVNSALDFETMSTRQLISYAASVGVDAKLLCGVDSCSDHEGWVPVKEAFHNSKNAPKYVHGLDIVWCERCWSWLRDRKPLELDD